MLFKEFAGVDALPLCLDTRNVDDIVTVVKGIAPVFGGINLENIAAPRCFEIERRLRAALDIPVFHDDQHGTAIVVLAALVNALRIVGKRAEDVTVVIVGAGAGGISCTEMLLAHGVGDVVVCNRRGALYAGADGLDTERAALAERTNRRGVRGTPDEVLAGADVLIGVSGPEAVSPVGARGMAPEAIVFAMANPVPEVHPEEVRDDLPLWRPGALTIPTRSTTCSPSPASLRARSRCGRARSTRR